MDKKKTRALALEKRDGLTEEQRRAYSDEIIRKVTNLSFYQRADALLTYVSFRSEVDTFPLIRLALQEGKAVFAPRVSGRDMEFFRFFSVDDLAEGYGGILEPAGTTSYIDWISRFLETKAKRGRSRFNPPRILVCMPGTAFDRDLHRIGYGGGFYDRRLSEMRERPTEKITAAALAFDCQIFEKIPWEAHDVCPECIITEKEILS